MIKDVFNLYYTNALEYLHKSELLISISKYSSGSWPDSGL